jgi:hypothetical protein
MVTRAQITSAVLCLFAACVSQPVTPRRAPQGGIVEAASVAQHRDQQRVRHYVYFNTKRERITEPWFLASAIFDGAQLKYTWPELEPEKNRYDFSGIRHDLTVLRRNGKRLFIQLQDVSFHASIINAPRYLLTDTAYHEGIAGQYARDEDSTGKPAGYVARRWDPAVRDRFQQLIAALGQEFDGQIEGINLPETAVEFGTTGALFPSGFTPTTYRDGVVDNIRALRRSFRASVAMQYANFMPGEWLPDEDKGYLRSVYAEARRLKLAMGGPDLRPLRRGQRNHTYAMLRTHRGVAPTGIAVQWGNYEDVDPTTGAPITVPKLVEFATDTLGVHYIFWEPQEPFFGRDVLPFLERAR